MPVNKGGYVGYPILGGFGGCLSIVQGMRGYYGLFGLKGLLLAATSRVLKEPVEILVSVPGIKAPLHLRIRTTDVSLFSEILIKSEYDWQFSKSPKVIVDAGANIGLSPVFFARKYPNATVIAIEPEPSNFELLQKNTAPYPNVLPVHAALWGDNCDLSIADPGYGNWGYQTVDDRDEAVRGTSCRVPGTTLDKLMRDFGVDYVDILKIDIEGAEKEVFESCSTWIQKVGVIVVELHDRFKPGCSRCFHQATVDFEFECERGEITVVARKDFVASALPHLETREGPKLPCRIIGTVRRPEEIRT